MSTQIEMTGVRKINILSVRAFGACVSLAFAGFVNAAVIDFEAFDPGRIIDDEYAPVVLIHGSNFRYDVSEPRAVIFDTSNPTGGDIDLGGPFDSNNSELADNFSPGNVLIIQERDDCDFQTGFCATPDDEGRRPAGEFEFVFSADVVLETIDFFDIEAAENSQNPDSEIRLYDADGLEIQPGNWFVPGTGGDNMWDRLDFGAIEGVRSFVIELNGSGAIDNVTYTMSPVPVPASVWLFASALGFLGWARQQSR